MSNKKNRKVIYLTADDEERLEARTGKLLVSASAYITELIMWDNQMELIEACREGLVEIKQS